MKLLILYFVLIIIQLDDITCPLAPTWEYCECRFLEWSTWSDCTEKCYGRRRRTRKVRLTQHVGCDEFTDCASNGMGNDYGDCNQFCYNGGSHSTSWASSPCKCVPGKIGRCCDQTVTCSSLYSPSNGKVSYSSLTYGSTATYRCNTDYNITTGSQSRTCGENGGWSGTKPVCRYVNSCSSNPCKNGGQCRNEIEDFTCQCTSGWTGKSCETDIQPPVMTGCPDDESITTKESTYNISWTIPQFSDPMGHTISVTTNYPKGFAVVPWGDYIVQYVATKRFNGLKTECKFAFKVRPNPCSELNVPTNGARVCNGWKTEYAGVCLVYCSEDFMLELNQDPRQFYVCGASGNWIPSGPLPDCSMPSIDIKHLPDAVSYHYKGTCQANRQAIQQSYIDRLKNSNQRALCDKDPEECKPENVSVDC